MNVSYRIHTPYRTVETDDSEVAEHFSTRGSRVTSTLVSKE